MRASSTLGTQLMVNSGPSAAEPACCGMTVGPPSMMVSLIGAIVGEYFGGSSDVLGRVVVQSSSALRFDVTWAAIILAAITGIVLYLVIVVIERAVIPWHASIRSLEP